MKMPPSVPQLVTAAIKAVDNISSNLTTTSTSAPLTVPTGFVGYYHYHIRDEDNNLSSDSYKQAIQ